MNDSDTLPYRGTYGDPRPARLDALALPPAPMPSHRGARPLQTWRYVGVFGSELMLCATAVRVGRFRRSFWAVWDRISGRLSQGEGGVSLGYGTAAVEDRELRLDLAFTEEAGVETVCPSGEGEGEGYAWTRKQGGVLCGGTLARGGAPARPFAGRAIVDDTAAYYPRHTHWRWSAGVGNGLGGGAVAWSLVQGVNDPPRDSERTVWIDGVAREVEPVSFADDLSSVGALRFDSEAMRERSENRLVVRSRYRQPFGTFSGSVGGVALAEGWGVMEDHDVHW